MQKNIESIVGKPETFYESLHTLSKIEWVDLTTVHDNRPSALVTSPTAEMQFRPLAGNFNFTDHLAITNGTATYIDGLRKNMPTTDAMYAVGGGRVIDIARLLAYEWNMDITAIPTIISSDSPFVNCTGVRDNGCVRYDLSKKADRVLLDWNILRQSPKQFHAAGSVDVLSIYTALYDWKLASDRHAARLDEPYVNAIADQANNILKYLMSNEIDIVAMSQTGLKSIVQALCMEVELCNLYGNSRPEEGGEHFFAYAIESRLPHAIHGELVGLGILITACMQRQPWQDIQHFMDSIGMNYRPNGVSAQIITDTLKGMREYVERHALRYSIWNEYDHDEQNIKTFLNAIHI